ncbi:MAG: hypothetical protein JWP38_3153 [Herbaspirillum sp.]|jgi:hypothetical protein|nr:hypothetical protein [Herbaspirillum sp.]
MTTYAITAVEIDERTDLVTRIKWGSVDTLNNAWIEGPGEADVEEAMHAISAGDDVYTIFPDGEHTVLGPRLELSRDSSGRENIVPVFDQLAPGRAITDLPRIITH